MREYLSTILNLKDIFSHSNVVYIPSLKHLASAYEDTFRPPASAPGGELLCVFQKRWHDLLGLLKHTEGTQQLNNNIYRLYNN